MPCQRVDTGGLQEPGPRGLRIEHGFHRRKCLGGDDEQGGFRVNVCQDRVQIVAVDVRHEMHAQPRVAIGTQCECHHFGTEIGAADTNIDDVGNGFATVPQPCTRADTVRELFDAVEHLMHFGAALMNGLI